MPFEVKIKHLMVKYEPNTGYELTYNDVERCNRIYYQTNSKKEFLLTCLAGGIAVAFIGVAKYFIEQRIGIPLYAIAQNCVIFEAPIPAEREEEFDRFIANDLADHLHDLFVNAEDQLREVIGDDLDQVDFDILKQLKATKVSEVTICDSETVKKAKAAAVKSAAVKSAAPKEQPAPPKNVTIKGNPQSPSTSFLVFYDRPQEENADSYVVTVQSLDEIAEEKPVEVETNDQFAILKKLLPGQSYLVSVQSKTNGIRSSKVFVKDPVRTAPYDPHPWRFWDTSSMAGDSAYGTSVAETEVHSIDDVGQAAGSDDLGDPELWESDLHRELKKILRVRFSNKKMKLLLCKCDELGIVEAKDLKYLESKDITDELKGAIKPVEILKLMDYAKDQYSGSFHRSSGTSGDSSNIVMDLSRSSISQSEINVRGQD